ncbi:mannose-P-dolichol utilization defect [Acrasis kona]|uniref:Mannose-P-dolichol utilization defect 1 protein homolog n=1 Tax=Acrasis kona TaxID=1008807 RepID=A0AAW2Z7L1_9EUKA
MEQIGKVLDLGPKCTQSLFVDFSFAPECLKLLFSKLLGYFIILGAMFFKIPQILAILRNKSVQGLSLSMFVLELVGHMITLSYNLRHGNPFSTYGETFFVILQNVVILLLFFTYRKGQASIIFFLLSAGFASGAYTLLNEGLLPMETLQWLQAATIPIFTASKVPQILSNFSNLNNASNLSFITFFMQFGGSAARVFTTLQEVDDQLILAGFLLGLILNGVLLAQIVIYNFSSKSVKKASSASVSKEGTPKKKTKKVE